MGRSKVGFFGFYKFVEPYRCCRCALARFPFITARCERPARLWQKSHRARPQRTAFLLYFAFNSGRQTLAKKKNTNNINTRVTRARTNTYARRSTEISSSGSYDIQTNVLRCPYLFEFLLAETLLVRFSLVFLLCLFVLLPQLIMTNLTATNNHIHASVLRTSRRGSLSGATRYCAGAPRRFAHLAGPVPTRRLNTAEPSPGFPLAPGLPAGQRLGPTCCFPVGTRFFLLTSVAHAKHVPCSTYLQRMRISLFMCNIYIYPSSLYSY